MLNSWFSFLFHSFLLFSWLFELRLMMHSIFHVHNGNMNIIDRFDQKASIFSSLNWYCSYVRSFDHSFIRFTFSCYKMRGVYVCIHASGFALWICASVCVMMFFDDWVQSLCKEREWGHIAWYNSINMDRHIFKFNGHCSLSEICIDFTYAVAICFCFQSMLPFTFDPNTSSHHVKLVNIL